MSINFLKNISSAQCRAARELLGWKQLDLKNLTGIAISTIVNFELGKRNPNLTTIERIKRAFEDHGIRFFDDSSESGVSLIKKETNQIKTSQNNLTVVKAFLLGSGLEELLAKKTAVRKIPYDWSDRLLDDLAGSKLDFIIYNSNRTRKFINDRYLENIEIIDHCCFSMGGDNFFLLGKKDVWKETSLTEFQRNIKKNDKTIIVTSRNSDNIDNLSLLIDINDPKVKIVNLPAETIRKETFDINPNILICGSQNSRFNLLYQDDVIEVLNLGSISDKKLKNQIISNSENSFVVNKKIYDIIPKKDLLELIKEAKRVFHDLTTNHEGIDSIVSKLLDSVNHIAYSKDNAEFIVNNILYKTYRIGKPI